MPHPHQVYKLTSHASKVRTLFKQWCRAVEPAYIERSRWSEERLHKMKIRQEFDRHAHVTDPVEAKQLLIDGDQRLKKYAGYEHWMGRREIIPANEPGGVMYKAEPHRPDWIFDTWHPLERAQYPEYFARREQRKIEHAERWNKKYGKPEDAPDFSHLKLNQGTDK